MWRRSDTRPAGRRCALLLSLTLLAGTVLAGLPLGASAATIADTVSTAVVSPRVFEPGGTPALATTILHYELVRPTRSTIEIVDYASRRIRVLRAATTEDPGAYDVAWDGRVAPGGALV